MVLLLSKDRIYKGLPCTFSVYLIYIYSVFAITSHLRKFILMHKNIHIKLYKYIYLYQ